MIEKCSEKVLSRRSFLKAMGISTAALAIGSCAPATLAPTAPAATSTAPEAEATPTPGREAPTGRKTTIELFEIWGGGLFDQWVKLAEIYERDHPDVGIKVTFSPGHGDNPKLLTAVAGGVPPDMAMIVDFSTAQWVELGVMLDLTPYFEAAGLTGDDFWPAAWYLMNYKGKVWQMPFEVDPNFPFFWNKGIFRDVGLDPEKGPATIDEVDEFSKKINKIENGKVTRIGMVPWWTYGFGNSIYTWGWAFGGSFYDATKEEVTPDNEYVVKALEWMFKYAKEVGGPDQVAVTPPGLQVHFFGAGNVGMAPMVSANYRDVMKYNPDIEIGHGLLPYQPPGEQEPGAGAWISGWRLFIPIGAKNPDAAWNFIYWVVCTPEGTEAEWNTLGFPPGWKHAPVFEKIKADPLMKPYYDVLVTAKHAKDPIPVGAFYQAQLEELAGEAVYGRMTPLAAMREAKKRTMEEWQRFKEQQG
ncbi:MAG: ABC transporter substrate-binding protein [Anaerolineae bacterium]|nr:ABC transporter substrate-binding protein [Anaerolineae bacterium]